MDVWDDLLATALGLHALVGVVIFFGGLCLFAVEIVRRLARERGQRAVVNNLYVENLHVHVNPTTEASRSEWHGHARELPVARGSNLNQSERSA